MKPGIRLLPARTCLRAAAAGGVGLSALWAVLDILTSSSAAPLVRLSAAARTGNVAAQVALARLEPERAGEHLAAALAGSPRRTELRLALAARESGGARERELLTAARWDRGWEPAWQLANHYAQAGCGEDAWRWLLTAAGVWRGDPRPIFRLAGLLAKEAEIPLVAERVWPGSRLRKREHLDYLLRAHHGAAHAVAAELATGVRAPDAPWLGAYVRQALAGNAVVDLRPVWRSLAAAGWLSEQGPARLTEKWPGGEDPLGWRMPETPGVWVARGRDGALDVELRGSQPDRCTLACRTLLAEPGDYRVSLGESAGAAAGVAWDIAARGEPLARIAPLISDGRRQTGGFQVPEPGLAVEVCLTYARPAGTARAQGRFTAPRLDWERNVASRTTGTGYGTEN